VRWAGGGAAGGRALLSALLAVVLSAVLPARVAAEVPYNTPMQVVMPTINHTSMVPVTDTLQAISRHTGSIAVVSVVGPYHSGKSFLLNALLGQTQVFSIGRRTSPETMGIWLCRTKLKASDGSEVWLLDSEGFFGPGVTESYDAKVFTIASLIGAHLVYNTVKIIDQQAVNLLEMLARRAQLFRTKSSASEQSGVETPEFLSVRSFPPLTWVVEDFIQELPEQHRHADGATDWLRSYLSKLNATEDGGTEDDHFLSRLYSDLKVHTLFLPATSKEGLQDLSRMKWEQLTPEFRDELGGLRKHILSKLTARTFEGKAMSGQTLDRALRFMVQALQRGMFHELPSLWATWTQQVAELSLQDAESWFSSLIDAVDMQETPVRLSEFNTQVEEARSKAERFYGDLLNDFFVAPDNTELHRRMALKYDKKLILYHGRILSWVSELIQVAKNRVSTLLSHRELPEDPDTLKKLCENETQASKETFAQKIAAFSEQGQPRFPFAAQMPPFSQDPQYQLDKDLKSIQGAREHENEMKILQVFKMAVDAANVAVEQEIAASSNRLLGVDKMKELKALVSASCWQAFDGTLAQKRWMLSITHYKTHKALVQTDTIERRMAKLAVDNEQRLRAHFNAALERCKNHYKAQKATLAMPVAEEDLDRDHKALGVKVRDMLAEQCRDVSDTRHFREAMLSLDQVLEEGLQHVRQKNIDRWKVDSDEATRCALRENRAVMAKCGLTCLFNKVPRVHKLTSQRHLLDCLKNSGAGTRMPPKLQYQVFENWYSKDLGSDAAAVTNNFTVGVGAIGLIILFSCVKCSGWNNPTPPPQVHSAYGLGPGGGFGYHPQGYHRY